ncbi:MAG: hypothetical protein Q8K55_06090 [Gemmatimonadaceae bacterium]|nr:hypothetical protein [Gemmatimonadaceae bacterium]
MKFRKLLSVVGIMASLALASTASAKVTSAVWTCNSDGFLHVVITSDDGSVREWIYGSCGPSIAVGQGFNLVFGEKRMVSPRGQTFLNSLEKGGAIPARRVAAPAAGASRSRSERAETIQLKQAEVGPQLAAFLTGIDAGWREARSGAPKAFSIFDRWGKLITARGPLALVPGDVGLSVPAKGEAGDKRNAKDRCLDKHGIWREKPKGEWGCWTTAK